MIEQRGKAAAVICTEQFASSARMTAQTFGMADFPYAEILHRYPELRQIWTGHICCLVPASATGCLDFPGLTRSPQA